MAVVHETGHARYEQASRGMAHLPVGKARTFAVHESQSLLVEMQSAAAARSSPIWRRCSRALGDGGPCSSDNLYRQAIRVVRGLVRMNPTR